MVCRLEMAPHKQLGESQFVNGSKTPCGVVLYCCDTCNKDVDGSKEFTHSKAIETDEFYIQIGDIGSRYCQRFKSKIIFLNCDDLVECSFLIISPRREMDNLQQPPRFRISQRSDADASGILFRDYDQFLHQSRLRRCLVQFDSKNYRN